MNPNYSMNNVLVIGNSHSIDFFDALFLKRKEYSGYHFLTLRKSIELSCFNENIYTSNSIRDEVYTSDQYKSANVIIVASVNYYLNNFYQSKIDKWLPYPSQLDD